MLKYSGDIDGSVPTTGTLGWIESLGRDVVREWSKYHLDDGTLGGYVKSWDGLTLGTVHGAGHMAPQFKPAATYKLIFNWINQEPLV